MSNMNMGNNNLDNDSLSRMSKIRATADHVRKTMIHDTANASSEVHGETQGGQTRTTDNTRSTMN